MSADHYSVGQELYFEWSPYSRRRGGGETVTAERVAEAARLLGLEGEAA